MGGCFLAWSACSRDEAHIRVVSPVALVPKPCQRQPGVVREDDSRQIILKRMHEAANSIRKHTQKRKGEDLRTRSRAGVIISRVFQSVVTI